MLIFNYLIFLQFYQSLANPSKAVDLPNVQVSSNPSTLLSLLNNLRIQAGVQPLTLNSKLSQAALLHSNDQFKQGKMTHTGTDNSDVKIRADRAGYKWTSIGENIAYNQKTELEVTLAWLNSPEHKANMLASRFDEVGFGYFKGYWTEVFGKL